MVKRILSGLQTRNWGSGQNFDLLARTGGLGLRIKIWEFPKIRGTFLGVPITRTIVTIVFWGLYWGPLILGNYHMVAQAHETSIL